MALPGFSWEVAWFTGLNPTNRWSALNWQVHRILSTIVAQRSTGE